MPLSQASLESTISKIPGRLTRYITLLSQLDATADEIARQLHDYRVAALRSGKDATKPEVVVLLEALETARARHLRDKLHVTRKLSLWLDSAERESVVVEEDEEEVLSSVGSAVGRHMRRCRGDAQEFSSTSGAEPKRRRSASAANSAAGSTAGGRSSLVQSRRSSTPAAAPFVIKMTPQQHQQQPKRQQLPVLGGSRLAMDLQADVDERCPLCGLTELSSPMVACDRCDRWYHYICVSFVDDGDEARAFFCPDCNAPTVRGTGPRHAH